MKIEIWSDIMCPFCYIGKRKFEKALDNFEHKDVIEVEWKSFQLMPDLITDPSVNAIEHLAKSKGWTMEYTNQATTHVVNMAKDAGLSFNYDKTVVANSMRAHALLHLAKKNNKQNELKELLLSAYFIEGYNTDDKDFLLETASKIGLSKSIAAEAIDNEEYHFEVKRDIQEGQQLGLTGVPFFVFNRKYAISGAQDVKAFEETLKKSFKDWEVSQSSELKITTGDSCDLDGNC